MASRVLVANRGEIAVRVIRACHELGIAPCVVHSDPDASVARRRARRRRGRASPDRHRARPTSTSIAIVAAAVGRRVRRGPPRLRIPRRTGRLRRGGVGAGLDVGRSVGRRDRADGRQARGPRRSHATPACPLVPGATLAVEDPAAVIALGEQLGWPLTVKAVHGGGGRGMRVLTGPDDAAESLAAAQRESAVVVRPARGLRRALPRRAAPRRGAAHRRPPRHARDRRRPRLLDPAPIPEADRGGPGPAPRARGARRPGRCGDAPGDRGRLHQRRHRRVPGRWRRAVLPRDEHPHPGRAPGHRAGEPRRPRRRAAPRSPTADRCRSDPTTCTHAARPSRCGSTPRTRAADASSRRQARSTASNRPAAPTFGSTPVSGAATCSPPTTTT